MQSEEWAGDCHSAPVGTMHLAALCCDAAGCTAKGAVEQCKLVVWTNMLTPDLCYSPLDPGQHPRYILLVFYCLGAPLFRGHDTRVHTCPAPQRWVNRVDCNHSLSKHPVAHPTTPAQWTISSTGRHGSSDHVYLSCRDIGAIPSAPSVTCATDCTDPRHKSYT